MPSMLTYKATSHNNVHTSSKKAKANMLPGITGETYVAYQDIFKVFLDKHTSHYLDDDNLFTLTGRLTNGNS